MMPNPNKRASPDKTRSNALADFVNVIIKLASPLSLPAAAARLILPRSWSLPPLQLSSSSFPPSLSPSTALDNARILARHCAPSLGKSK
jgi:hypothetical protein